MLKLDAALPKTVTPDYLASSLKGRAVIGQIEMQSDDFTNRQGKAGIDARSRGADVLQDGVGKLAFLAIVYKCSEHRDIGGVAER